MRRTNSLTSGASPPDNAWMAPAAYAPLSDLMSLSVRGSRRPTTESAAAFATTSTRSVDRAVVMLLQLYDGTVWLGPDTAGRRDRDAEFSRALEISHVSPRWNRRVGVLAMAYAVHALAHVEHLLTIMWTRHARAGLGVVLVVAAGASAAGAQSAHRLTIRGHEQRFSSTARRPETRSSSRAATAAGCTSVRMSRSSWPRAASSSSASTSKAYLAQLHLAAADAATRGRAGRLRGARRRSPARGDRREADPGRRLRRRRAVGARGDRSADEDGDRRRHRPGTARRQRAGMALEGFGDLPDARRAERADVQHRERSSRAWRPLPLAAIHSTHDEFVPRRGRPARAGSARASRSGSGSSTPSDHRFSDNLPEFDERLLEAIDWVQAARPQ